MRNKKSWKRLMALALSAAMLVPAQATYATEGQAEEIELETYAESGVADEDGFEIEDGVLKSYTGTATEVVIPEGVTSIGERAFVDNSRLISVSIPQSVTNIGTFAFAGCYALMGICIPAKVVSIGENAFVDCPSLETIIVEDGNTVYDSRDNCNAIIETESNTLVLGCQNTIIPEGTKHIDNFAFFRRGITAIHIPEGVTSIGDSAFFACNMEEVDLPEELTSIGITAFSQCSELTKISIPEKVTDIGKCAFELCGNLETIEVAEGNSVYDSRENCNAIIETESNTLILGCQNTIIPKGVPNIGDRAFMGSKFKKINIPENVTNIGRFAFWMCINLEEVYIPESVKMIGEKAFNKDSGKLTIFGKTGSYAEIYAKENKIKFSSTGMALNPIGKKTISSDNVSLSQNSYTYDGKAKKPTVTVKDGSKTLVENTDYTVAYSNNVNVGTAKVTVTGKGNYTGAVTKEFSIKEAPAPEQKVKELSRCTIAVSKTSYTYDGKAKKPTVTVKDGAAVLKEGTDYTVTYSNNVNAGKAKVTVTGKGNYKGTVAKDFTITVKKGTAHKIGSYQYKVTGTSTVSMKGVKDNKIAKVKVPKTVKIGGKTFKVTAIDKNTFKNNKKITSIEIGNNVKTIGTSAFEGCTKLTKITVGKSVTEIGGSAFKNCKKLGTITIKSNDLKKVGKYALKGIKATAKIKVPAKKLPAYKKLLKNKGQGRKVKIVK